MSCHLRGGDRLRRALEANIARTGQQGVVVKPASCLGRCDRAPAAAINDTIVDDLSTASLVGHVDTVLAGGTIAAQDAAPPAGPLVLDPYAGDRPYQALRDLVASRDTDGL